MSKSKGNVINPDDIVQSHGADTFYVFTEMFMGPLDAAIVGVKKVRWVSSILRSCMAFNGK